MHARVSTYEGTPEAIERSPGQADEAAAAVRAMPGSLGLIYLIDPGSGRSVSITLWESAEAMAASEEAANSLRQSTSDAAGERIVGVDRYEVAHLDVSAAT